MAKRSEAAILIKALKGITVDDLLDLSQEDAVVLALAFEEFVDKIGQVVQQSQGDSRQLYH